MPNFSVASTQKTENVENVIFLYSQTQWLIYIEEKDSVFEWQNDRMCHRNRFLVFTVPEWTALHLAWLGKRDPMGRKFSWQTSMLLFSVPTSEERLWDPLIKIVYMVIFYEVPGTFMVSALAWSHSGILWRNSEEFEAHSRRFIGTDWKKGLGSFVQLICLCWCFNAYKQVAHIHVIRYLMGDGGTSLGEMILDCYGQQKWTGYCTEWDSGESQYLNIVLKGRLGNNY